MLGCLKSPRFLEETDELPPEEEETDDKFEGWDH